MTRSTILWVALCLTAGLLARWFALQQSVAHGCLSDHLDFMAWADYAYEHGPTRLYDLPPDIWLNTNLPFALPEMGRFAITPVPASNRCNEPPLACYVFWVQGLLWHHFDPDIVMKNAAPSLVRLAGHDPSPVESLVVNTPTSRFMNAAPAVVADFLLAWGVAALVRLLRVRRPDRRLELLAFALTLLAPPIVLNSSFWNQTDAWLACLLVWCMNFLLQERFGWAGLWLGLALLTKPQTVLFLPVLVYIFFALRFSAGGSWRRALRLFGMLPTVLAVVALLAAPFSFAGRHHPQGGWLRWFQRSYEMPLGEQYPFTTMNAFNVWWLDYLAQSGGARSAAGPRFDEDAALDSRAAVGGLSKDAWGKLLLAAGLVCAAVLCAWRWRWQHESWVAFAFLVMFAAFVLPTRAHERHIYYCLPFLIVAALQFHRWIPVLVALLIVAGFEMTWFVWYSEAFLRFERTEPTAGARTLSGVLAAACVATYLYALGTLLFKVSNKTCGTGLQTDSGPVGDRSHSES